MADTVYATHTCGTEIHNRGKSWVLVDGELERELTEDEARDIAVNGRGWRHSKEGWTIHRDVPHPDPEGDGYDDMTVAELRELAKGDKKHDPIEGRSGLDKEGLIAALRERDAG